MSENKNIARNQISLVMPEALSVALGNLAATEMQGRATVIRGGLISYMRLVNYMRGHKGCMIQVMDGEGEVLGVMQACELMPGWSIKKDTHRPGYEMFS